MKLKAVLDLFKGNFLTKQQNEDYGVKINPKEVKDMEILTRYMDKYFPTRISNHIMTFNPNQKLHNSKQVNIYSENFLPFYIGDNVYLMKYVYKIVKEHEKNDYDISPKNIKKFIQENPEFKAKRDQYEQLFTAKQIEYMLNKPIPNAFMDEKYSPYFNKNFPNYDIVFREEVVRSLTMLGFNQRNVELSLEKNASLWLKQTMIISFENQFYPLADIIETHGEFDAWWQRLAKFKQKHQEEWLKRREFNHYREHREIIDAAGCATRNMRMSIQEVTMVDAKLARMEKRLQKILASKDKVSFAERLKGLKKSLAQNHDDSRTIIK